MFKVRLAEKKDIDAFIDLLRNYMKEALQNDWGGSISAFERDGFGKEFTSVVAESSSGEIIGFGLWKETYDTHHCISGGELSDFYVIPKYRGRGIALAIVALIARQIQEIGGKFLKGKSIPDPQVEHLYNRVAISYPGTEFITGGRAFRKLAELSGKPPREMVSALPNKSWNYEP